MKQIDNEKNRKKERLPFPLNQDPLLFNDFICDSLNNLELIELHTIELKIDSCNEIVLVRIFKLLHIISGRSSFLNLKHINRISSKTELFLNTAIKEKFVLDSDCIDLLFDVISVLRNLIRLSQIQLNGKTFQNDEYPDVENLLKYISILTLIKYTG
jgi:chemotaxis protein histidine kinase CheA